MQWRLRAIQKAPNVLQSVHPHALMTPCLGQLKVMLLVQLVRERLLPLLLLLAQSLKLPPFLFLHHPLHSVCRCCMCCMC